MVLLFVDGIAPARLEPAEAETYGDGVRKITYRDADGNEVSFGGAPAEPGAGSRPGATSQRR